MDYRKKKHWVKYHSGKCKMYLRNDFRFTCAYCGMKEQDNIAGELNFEKDHFVARSSEIEIDLDDYDNMVYSCCKCNGTKSDQNLKLILNPCKDDIYEGESPVIKKLGAENHYMLQALTAQGQAFIDSLKLNSRYYRKMREKQERNNEIRELIFNLLDENGLVYMSETVEKLKVCLENGSCYDEKSDEFRCGISKAGEDLFGVLKILEKKKIEYRLIFADNDLDVVLDFCGNTYYCELKVSDYAGRQRRNPQVNVDKKRAWLNTGNHCGILYYYKSVDALVLFICSDETKFERYEL